MQRAAALLLLLLLRHLAAADYVSGSIYWASDCGASALLSTSVIGDCVPNSQIGPNILNWVRLTCVNSSYALFQSYNDAACSALPVGLPFPSIFSPASPACTLISGPTDTIQQYQKSSCIQGPAPEPPATGLTIAYGNGSICAATQRMGWVSYVLGCHTSGEMSTSYTCNSSAATLVSYTGVGCRPADANRTSYAPVGCDPYNYSYGNDGTRLLSQNMSCAAATPAGLTASASTTPPSSSSSTATPAALSTQTTTTTPSATMPPSGSATPSIGSSQTPTPTVGLSPSSSRAPTPTESQRGAAAAAPGNGLAVGLGVGLGVGLPLAAAAAALVATRARKRPLKKSTAAGGLEMHAAGVADVEQPNPLQPRHGVRTPSYDGERGQ